MTNLLRHLENLFLQYKMKKEAILIKELILKISAEDLIPGGKADFIPESKFDSKELALGIKVELEHTNDLEVAKEIAKDHLMEDSKYYTNLSKWHKED